MKTEDKITVQFKKRIHKGLVLDFVAFQHPLPHSFQFYSGGRGWDCLTGCSINTCSLG